MTSSDISFNTSLTEDKFELQKTFKTTAKDETHNSKHKIKGEKIPLTILTSMMSTNEKIMCAGAVAFSILQGVLFPFVSSKFGSVGSSFGANPNLNAILLKLESQISSIALLSLGIVLLSFASAILWSSLSKSQSKKLKRVYFAALLHQSTAFHDSHSPETLSLEFEQHLKNFSELFSHRMNFFFLFYTQAISGLLLGLFRSFLFTLYVIALFPLILIFLNRYLSVLKREEGRARKQGKGVLSIMEESLRMIRVIKVSQMESHEEKRLSDRLLKWNREETSAGKAIGKSWGIFLFFNILLFVLIFFAGWIVVKFKWRKGLSKQLFTGEEVVGIIFSILPGLLSLANVEALQSKITFGKESFVFIHQLINSILSREGETISQMNGDIEFKQVSFYYPSNPKTVVLNNVSFKVKAGERVGLVGLSGSGKTTVLQLIERFYETMNGDICVDEQKIKDFSLSSYRKHIGLVPQFPIIFSGTLKDNIDMGRGYSDKNILRSLEMTGAQNLVEGLPNGLLTVMAPGSLSSGEKQKIAIARTLMGRPSILMFDESTSAFDANEEENFYRKLEEISYGATELHVVHHLEPLLNFKFDKILVFEKGLLKESGSPAELLINEQGIFKKILNEMKTKNNTKDKVTNSARVISSSSKNIIKEDDTDLMDEDLDNKVTHGLVSLKTMAGSSVSRTYTKALIKSEKDDETEFFSGIIGSVIIGGVSPVVGLLMAIMVFNICKNLDNLLWYLLFCTGLALACFVVSYFQFKSLWAKGSSMQRRLIKYVFSKLLRTEVSYFDNGSNRPSPLTLKILNETDSIRVSIGTSFRIVFQTISGFLIGVLISFLFSWKSAFISIGLYPILILFKYGESRFEIYYSSKNTVIDRTTLSESLSNFKLVKSLKSENFMINRFTKEDPSKTHGPFMPVVAGFVFGLSQLLNYLIYGLVFLFSVKAAVKSNDEPMSLLISIFVLIFSMVGVLVISEQIQNLQKAYRFWRQVRLIGDKACSEESSMAQLSLGSIESIEFKNVYFGYDHSLDEDQQILRNMSFKVLKNEKVGIFGVSGSGKTSIFELLLNFRRPLRGTILINNQNIESFSKTQLRQRFGILPQRGELFNETVGFNLSYGSDRDHEFLLNVAHKAMIYEFGGGSEMSREVGRGGEQLSGGQRQRVLIGRLMIKNPEVALMDEPTSSLDNKAKEFVRDNLMKMITDKTAIILSTRNDELFGLKRILVLHNGSIVEEGSYERLINGDSYFKRLSSKS